MQDFKPFKEDVMLSRRTFSAEELQGKENYQYRKFMLDVDPEKFVSDLRNRAGDLGYIFDFKPPNRAKITEPEGETRINLPVLATRTSKRRMLSLKRVLVVGATITGAGLLALFLNLALGVLILGLGEMAFISWLQRQRALNAAKKPLDVHKMWLFLEGTTHPADVLPGEEGAHTANMRRVSEITLHLAGESDRGVKYMREDITKFIRSIDSMYPSHA